MPESEYVRVTDDVKPRREYSVLKAVADANPKAFEVLDKPAVDHNGHPIPPKYAPKSLPRSQSGDAAPNGHQADTSKENH